MIVAAGLTAAAMALGVAGFSLIRGSEFDRVVAAGERTEDSGTARVAVVTVVDAGVGRSRQRLDLVGLVDFGSGATQLEVRIGAPTTSGEPAPGGVSLMLVDDGTDVYVRDPAGPPDQAWARLEPAQGELAGVADGLAALLRSLRPGVTRVEEIGEEQVRGEATTHHRVTVDLVRASRAAPAGDRTELSRLTDIQGRDDLTLDVWVDGERVRRLSYALDLTRSSQTSGEPSATASSSVSPSVSPSEAPPSGAATGPGATADEAGVPGLGTEALAPGARYQVILEYFDFGVPFAVEVPENVEDAAGAPSAQSSAEPSPAARTP